jgi:hypothetical protein
VIPPPVGTPAAAVRACAECVHQLAYETGIDAINIPEVRDEVTRPGPRMVQFVPKIEPRAFGRLIQEGFSRPLEAIVDRGIVYTHWANQRRWLCRTWRDYRIRNLLLVGGESSKIRYPGPPVTEAARRIQHDFGPQGLDYFLGGITIPTRRGEPERLIEKAACGIEFFTSQVLYEAENTQKLLKSYHNRCRERGVKPKRIFLSFAPVSSKRDLEFLKWLGVEVPEAVEREILNGWIGTAWRSIQVAERVLGEILAFARDEKLDVPLGINVEHVMKHNFEVSRDMVLALRELYCQYLRCTRRARPLRSEGVTVRLR